MINLDFDADMSVTVTVNGWLVKQSNYVMERFRSGMTWVYILTDYIY